MSDTPSKNNDKHLWPIPNDDYYAPSIHATEDGRIGMNVGGIVFVKSIREWHSLAGENYFAGPDDTILGPGQVAVDREDLEVLCKVAELPGLHHVIYDFCIKYYSPGADRKEGGPDA